MRGKELIFFQKTFMDIKNDFLYLNKKRFSIIEIFTMNLSSTTENSRMSLLNIIIRCHYLQNTQLKRKGIWSTDRESCVKPFFKSLFKILRNFNDAFPKTT